MDRRSHIIERITAGTDLYGESMPGQTIIEIAGEHRVLIENHFGITQYCCDKIFVKVKYGQVVVCGCNLELLQMTKDQLVISGKIDGVSLLRRGK